MWLTYVRGTQRQENTKIREMQTKVMHIFLCIRWHKTSKYTTNSASAVHTYHLQTIRQSGRHLKCYKKQSINNIYLLDLSLPFIFLLLRCVHQWAIKKHHHFTMHWLPTSSKNSLTEQRNVNFQPLSVSFIATALRCGWVWWDVDCDVSTV